MPNGTYGGVRGRKTKVGRKLSFSSYSISRPCYNFVIGTGELNIQLQNQLTDENSY